MTLKRLGNNYKSFFSLWKNGDKNARPPKYKGKNFFTTLCYNQTYWESFSPPMSYRINPL
ncbi:MAG: hypothetical protein EU541_00085 [Promethearchaeota archaeon]|nr:MAG: hypothetical protein EU541_00085 [Candidatus Lokiarchaeota archaeon]